MNIAIFIFGFTVGIVATFTGLTAYASSFSKRMAKSMNRLNDSTAEANGLAERKDLIDKLRDITEQQLILRDQLDLPQKNSLHGKHKNQLVNQVKKLEEEKLDLLRRILATGYDPVISTMDEFGNTELKKLSEYLQELELEQPIKEPPLPKERPRFEVIKGGKGEATDDNDSDR